MAIERVYGFEAQEEDMVVYNGVAVIDLAFYYNFDDEDETEYTFPGYSSSYMNVYDSRGQYLIKSFAAQITRNSNVQVINASVLDMTFADTGTYYYELGYVRSGGYSIPLRYGKLEVI